MIYIVESQNDRPMTIHADELQVRGPHKIAVRSFNHGRDRNPAWVIVETTGSIVQVQSIDGGVVYG